MALISQCVELQNPSITHSVSLQFKPPENNNITPLTMQTVRPTSSELAVVAERELNEDPTQLRSHLEVIRTWLSEHDTIQGELSDQILLSFLRGCKFSLEKAKQKLALFYRIRTGLPEVVQNRDPLDEHVLQVIRLG